jgi:hypothetical protein
MQPKKHQQINALAKLVAEEALANPFERGGYQWAAQPQLWWCDKLGYSVETLRRMIGQPPFVREQASVDGKKMTLLRVLADGEAPKKTPERVANELRKIWLARKIDTAAIKAAAKAGKAMKTDKILKDGVLKMSSRDHGCLIGLAQVWPDGMQHAILKCVLKDWPAFMVGAKLKLGTLQDEVTGDTDLPIKGALFLKFPHLPTIRKFADVALELFIIDLQQKGAIKP